jgi:N-sulfoglucosamine sulfohydrolase
MNHHPASSKTSASKVPALSRRQFLWAGAATAAAIAASRPAKAQAKRPNILFFIADDWGRDHASCFGAKWINTPAVDRVAREGVVFTNCFTSNPKCCPSRASILTGRNSWQLKEVVNHYSIFPNEFEVFPDVLEKSGYFVGLTGKGWGPGDYQSTGWKRNPAGPEFQSKTLKPPLRFISNRDYAANFEDFLSQRPADKPFCFWLGTHEPHRAYEEGAGLRAGKKLEDVTVPKYWPDTEVVRSDLLDYALEVEWVDQHLGRVLKTLEDAGELDNTLLVLTSDHGMPFPRVKGQIYEDSFHIPMVVRWPAQVKAGRTVDDFINFRDIAPTFCEVAGLPPAPTMTGKSFLDVLKSGESGIVDESRDVMLTGKERHDLGRPNDWGYPVRAIRTRDFLYIRNYHPERWPAGDPETGYRNVDDSPTKRFLLGGFDEYYRLSFGKRPAEELYHISEDPDCLNNLADNIDFAQRKREMQSRMNEMLREEGDPRALGQAEFFETIRYTGPRRHAYDTWLKNQEP